MRVTRASVTRVCAICERTLLMGEHALRFAPDGARARRRLPALPGDRARARLGARGLADLGHGSRRAAARTAQPRRAARHAARGAPPRRRSPPSRSCAGSPSRSSRSSRPPTSSTPAPSGARSRASPARSASRRRRSCRSPGSAARW